MICDRCNKEIDTSRIRLHRAGRVYCFDCGGILCPPETSGDPYDVKRDRQAQNYLDKINDWD